MGESAGVRKREVQTKETRIRRIERDTHIKRTGYIKGAEEGGRKRLKGERKRSRRKIKGERRRKRDPGGGGRRFECRLMRSHTMQPHDANRMRNQREVRSMNEESNRENKKKYEIFLIDTLFFFCQKLSPRTIYLRRVLK